MKGIITRDEKGIHDVHFIGLLHVLAAAAENEAARFQIRTIC